jgi:hypothetical protein
MTGVWNNKAIALMALVALTLAGGSGTAQPGKRPHAFAGLELGEWEIRESHGAKVEARSVCLGDPGVLVQLQHRNADCSNLVVSDEPREVTIQYTCPANGYGRTTVRTQTPRMVRIDTQGIADNAPFAFRAEARRLGPCKTSR